uniref:Uncharacterized protein n=1 Tax=Arundo donax TaxID=35708 RepID=A0A0A8YP67_ARUDO
MRWSVDVRAFSMRWSTKAMTYFMDLSLEKIVAILQSLSSFVAMLRTRQSVIVFFMMTTILQLMIFVLYASISVPPVSVGPTQKYLWPRQPTSLA